MIKKFGQYLNENIADSKYKTVLMPAGVDIRNYPVEEDQFVNAGNITVEWDLDLDSRSNGINSLGVSVSSIRGEFTLVTPGDKDDVEEAIQFDSKDFSVDSELTSELNAFGYPLRPNSIEIDFKTKTAKVLF